MKQKAVVVLAAIFALATLVDYSFARGKLGCGKVTEIEGDQITVKVEESSPSDYKKDKTYGVREEYKSGARSEGKVVGIAKETVTFQILVSKEKFRIGEDVEILR